MPFLTLACSLMFSITAFAGNINSAEQKIINAISGTYEYNGAYYKVTDAYIEKVKNYLNRDDIDMTESEAQSYINQFNSNISAGISGGYMESVDNSGDTDSSSEGNDNDNSSDNESGNSKEKPSGNKNDANSDDKTDTETSNGEGNVSTPDNSEEGNITSPGNSGEGNTPTGDAGITPSGGAVSMDIFNQSGNSSESGIVEDNTLGSTTDGEIEYTIFPMDRATMYVWDTDSLDVHAEAYKDSEIIGTLNKGDAVTITGAATTGWAQIDYNGETGYVSAVYLRTQNYMSVIEESEITDNEADSKDYSDAAPLKKSFNFGTIAIVIVIVCIIGSGIIIMWHRNKSRKR